MQNQNFASRFIFTILFTVFLLPLTPKLEAAHLDGHREGPLLKHLIYDALFDPGKSEETRWVLAEVMRKATGLVDGLDQGSLAANTRPNQKPAPPPKPPPAAPVENQAPRVSRSHPIILNHPQTLLNYLHRRYQKEQNYLEANQQTNIPTGTGSWRRLMDKDDSNLTREQ